MLILKRPWTIPRTGASVRPEISRFAAGVVCPGVSRNFIGPVDSTVVTGPEPTPTISGLAWTGNASSSQAYANTRRAAKIVSSSSESHLTALVVFRAVSATGTLVAMGSTDGSSGNTLCDIYLSTGALGFRLQTNAGILLYNTPSSAFGANDGNWHTAVVRAPLGVTTPESLDYFADGKHQGTVSRETGASATTFNVVCVNVIRRGGSSIVYGGYQVALFVPLVGVLMPDAWCIGATQSPSAAFNAIFAPQQIIIPTAAAAASSLPTLSASTYAPGSLTATGWRPQITAS